MIPPQQCPLCQTAIIRNRVDGENLFRCHNTCCELRGKVGFAEEFFFELVAAIDAKVAAAEAPLEAALEEIENDSLFARIVTIARAALDNLKTSRGGSTS